MFIRMLELSNVLNALSKVIYDFINLLFLQFYNIMNSFYADIFEPLYEVTKDPKTHPELHVFLQRVVGFDSVDDESKAERRIHKKYPCPKDWNTNLNPPYSYYLFHMYANMTSLN